VKAFPVFFAESMQLQWINSFHHAMSFAGILKTSPSDVPSATVWPDTLLVYNRKPSFSFKTRKWLWIFSITGN